jgi:hypothetical protein
MIPVPDPSFLSFHYNSLAHTTWNMPFPTNNNEQYKLCYILMLLQPVECANFHQTALMLEVWGNKQWCQYAFLYLLLALCDFMSACCLSGKQNMQY